MIGLEEKRRTAVRALRNSWDAAARDNAQFNVVTIPGQTEEEFFESGVQEVERVLARLADLGIAVERFQDGMALDFGCGLGRLSTAFAPHFRRVVGVDVSGEMISRARRRERVAYMRLDSLEQLARRSFDLIYTNITLQHMPGWLQRQYIDDFFALVRDDGAVVFELPDFPDMEEVRHTLAMGGASPTQVGEWIAEAGGHLVATDGTESAGTIPCWRYISTRRTQ